MVHRLLGRSLRHRYNRYEGAAFGFGVVLDATVDQCEQRMILADADILSRMPLGAALAHDNVAGKTALAAKKLHAQAVAGFALRLRFGFASCDGFLPSVRISVIRIRVNSARKPRFLREFLRRRFLNAITFGPRPCSTTSAATLAPGTGLPTTGVSPPTINTSVSETIVPGSPSSRATFSLSSGATRYCLPPVLMTANIFCLAFEPGARTSPDRLFDSRGFGFAIGRSCGQNKEAGQKTRTMRGLWRSGYRLSRNGGRAPIGVHRTL